MRTLRLAAAALLLAALLAPPALAVGPEADCRGMLDEYLRREHDFSWKVLSEEEAGPGVRVVKLELISQVWNGIRWKHRLNVLVPEAATGERARPGHALLLINGSGGEQRTLAFLQDTVRSLGVPVAVLQDVPNQPLFDNLREDALIAYSFMQFLNTGDPHWPALVPMTRSAVAAMDALGQWSASAPGWAHGRLEKFVVTGASKRGWTTWLTGAMDRRVIGIAPMVYDNLNVEAQMVHQLEVWGAPSASIHDYTERGLLDMLRTPRGRQIAQMVDPYSYVDRITQPKLILIGTNDSYWPLDAIHLYRGALRGDVYQHYVPNGGHSLGPSAVPAIVGFFDHVVGRVAPLPEVRLTVTPTGGRITLADPGQRERVSAVRLWGTRVAGRDFRQSAWESVPAQAVAGGWTADLPEACHADQGHAAFLGEVELTDSQGRKFTIHTPVQVWELGPRGK